MDRSAQHEAVVVVLLILVVGGILTRSPLLLLGAGLALVTAYGSRLLGRYSLVRLECTRTWSRRRCFAGETVDLRLQVTNRKLLPVTHLSLDQQVPEEVQPRDARLGLFLGGKSHWTQVWTLGWYQRVTRTYTMECRRRGYYVLPPAQLNGEDPFGFVSRSESLPETEPLIVYPELIPLRSVNLVVRRPLGDQRSRQRLFEDPLRFAGVREYRAGDPLQRIHWKATAATGRLQVKLLDPSSTLGVAVFCNVWSFARPWQGIDSGSVERAVSVAASVMRWAVDAQWPVGLYANGRVTGWGKALRLPPARGPQVLAHALEGLARLTLFSELAPGQLLLEELTRLPLGTTLVFCTRSVAPDLAAALRRATAAGWPVLLLWTGPASEVPRLPGMRIVACGEGVDLNAALA